MNFDNPWDWGYDHTMLERGITGSDFDIGIDKDGDALIHHDGTTRAINIDTVVAHIRDAQEDIE